MRLGIRGFNPALRSAQGKLETLHTPEGEPIPPNTLCEMNNGLARLAVIREQMQATAKTRTVKMDQAAGETTNAMVRNLARIVGVGVETADMPVHEVLSRDLRDRRAVARYAGLTGSPDESGAKRREKGSLSRWRCIVVFRLPPSRRLLNHAVRGVSRNWWDVTGIDMTGQEMLIWGPSSVGYCD